MSQKKSNFIMRKEDALIICCARTIIPPSFVKRIQHLVEENLDWEYVRQAAQHHAVLPLVYQALKVVDQDSLPDTFLQHLKNHFRSTVIHNMQMAADLLKILKLFEEHGIKAVPFKGPVLAENVYGDLGLRNFGDLDILLWPHDACKAIDLLNTLGFAPLLKLSPSQFTVYMKTEDDMVFTRQTDGLIVELHWEIRGHYLSRPFDMAFISSRLENGTLLTNDVQRLSAEDSLLYLCIHGTRHMWERLEWICGVAELIGNQKDLQWDKAFNLAHVMKCSRIFRHGLYLVHHLLDVKMPNQVTKELASDPVLPYLADQIVQHLFPLFRHGQKTKGGSRFNRLQFQVRDSVLEKIEYGWRQLIEPREVDWRWLPLPAHLAFMYWFLRPLRLSWQYLLWKC